ncbi:hypothetical protein [uncultured Alistipes sp.]|uniref:hypothetical protein n=1 Tax=uncultured Alistipes sp. TaxID=538949 RepID=UPI00267058CC|nr:hypothetical protein [uncultured Alistipes sp.]
MEDFGFLKWIAVIAVIAYNGVRQVRKNAKKGEKRRQTALGEAWPAQEHAFPPQSEPFGETAEVQPQRLAEMPSPRKQADFIAKKAKKESRERKTSSAPETPKQAEIQPENARNAEFELRQAVIMSEILKPKFDE